MLRRALCAATVLSMTLVAPLRADQAALKQAVKKLFDVGWRTSLKSRLAADRQWDVVEQLAPGDLRAKYAYALVLIKQRRYSDAVRQLDELLQRDSRSVPFWRAKLWLSVLTKHYDQALVEMDRLSQLVSDEAAPAEPAAKRLDAARLLGVMGGFLAGPAGGAVTKADLQAQTRRLLGRLNEEQQAAFEEGRRSVIERFSALSAEKTDSEGEAKEEAEQERQRQLADLEKQAEQIEAQRDELSSRRDKLRREAQQELAKITQEDRPLLDRLAQLDSQAVVVRRELALVVSEISRLRGRAQQEKDGIVKDSLLREADRLSILASRYDADLTVLRRQAAVIDGQRAELQRRYQQTQASYRSQLAALGDESAQLDRLARRNSFVKRKAGKPTKGDLRRARAIAARAKALSTYEEFPLEREKQRLLSLFP